MTQNVIVMGDAITQGLGLQAGNDGTFLVSVGPNGGKLNGLSIDATGLATLIKQPVVPAQSMVRLNTANGYGSTNTTIRRFTNVVTNQGTDITYADSATLGGSFTINTAGVYAINYTSCTSAASDIGVSLNSSQLSTTVNGITTSAILTQTTIPTANFDGAVSTTVYLPAGSVIRAHTDGVSSGTGRLDLFTITRIG